MRKTIGLLLLFCSTNLWSQEDSGDRILTAPLRPSIAITPSEKVRGEEHSKTTSTSFVAPSQSNVASILNRADDGEGECKPVWTKPDALRLKSKSVTLLTHFTRRLDTRLQTRPALKRLTRWSKAADVPVVYLQEQTSDPKLYFYDDCEPAAFVSSDVGHVEFETTHLEHIVIGGGLFELCFNNTFSDVVRNWRDGREEKTLRITLVTDAIYGVASDSFTQDEFDDDLRKWIKKQPTRTLLISAVLDQLQDRKHAWKFLSRRWGGIPRDFGLHVSFRDELTAIRFARKGHPTIWLEYTTMQEGFWPTRPDASLLVKH